MKTIKAVMIITLLMLSIIPIAIAESESTYRDNSIADLNSDGFVNDKDLDILMAYWGQEFPVGVRPSTDNSDEPKSPDINGDGLVDIRDFLEVLGSWGVCDGECPADLNGDREVDDVDLKILQAFWGWEGKNYEFKSPDLNTDGIVNVVDMTQLLGMWGPVGDGDLPDINPAPRPDVVPAPLPNPDNPEKPLIERFFFDGKNADDVMIDGLQVDPKKSRIFGKVKYDEETQEYNGRVKVNIGGFDEVSGERIKLRYKGDIREAVKIDLGVNAANSDSISGSYSIYQISSTASKLSVQKGKDRYSYENAELEMTYNPQTGEVNVNSMTGMLVEEAKNPKLSTSGLSDSDDSLEVVNELLETHAMGFESK